MNYFKFKEFITSETANRLGVINLPTDPVHLHNLYRLWDRLNNVRFIVQKPIRITSGYRIPEVNSAVSGVLNSKHTIGCAADLTCSDMDKLRYALDFFSWDEIIDHGTYIHVAL